MQDLPLCLVSPKDPAALCSLRLQAASTSENFYGDRRKALALRAWSGRAQLLCAGVRPMHGRSSLQILPLASALPTSPPSAALSRCRDRSLRGREAITHLAECVMRTQTMLSSARRPMPASPKLSRRPANTLVGDFGSSRECRSA